MNVGLLGVPSDLGANKDGSRNGARVLRKSVGKALKKNSINFTDYGDIVVPKALHVAEGKKRHYPAIKQLARLYIRKKKFSSDFPLIFGGDHSITMFHMHWLSQRKKVGLLYFDSHGDFNTPQSTPSGNIHGMVVARCVGRTLLDLMPDRKKFCDEKNVVLMGIRELDEKEKKMLHSSKITIITMKDIKRMGCVTAIQKALKIVNTGTEGFHLSIDLDVVDPLYAPAVSTPVKGGLSKRDLINVMKLVRKHNVLSADFVEYIPTLDKKGKTASIVTEAALQLVG
jgi:arginase